MRRRVVHAVFAGLALLLAIASADQAHRLLQANRVNDAIARAATPSPADAALAPARFAHARALAAAGHVDDALSAYKALVRDTDAPAALRQSAQVDLANLYLRTALKNGGAESPDSLPLIELAKQAYRDALRTDADDWDARYNLELALQLAPEADQDAVDDADLAANKQRAIPAAPAGRSDLP